MFEFQSQGVIAVLVASTTFLGLAGVITAQAKQNSPLLGDTTTKYMLVFSFLLGTIATFFAIVWFFGGADCFKTIAGISTVLQILLFWRPLWRLVWAT